MTKRSFASYVSLIMSATFLFLLAASQVATGVDSEIDSQFLLWNFGELGIGPKVTEFTGLFAGTEVSEQLINTMASYGYSLFTLLELPIMLIEKLLGRELGLPNYYMARNFLSVIVLMLCAHSIGRIIQMLRGSSFRNYGIGFCLTLFLPAFSGNGIFNVKDIPIATAMSFGILSSILVLNQLSLNNNPNRSIKFETFIYSLLTIFLSAGVRPASIFLVFIPFAIQLIGVLSLWMGRGRKETALLNVHQILGYLCGLIIVILTNSQAMRNPLEWFLNSITISGKFPWTGVVQADAVLYYAPNIPIEYWVKILFFKTPLLFIILSMIGFIVLLKSRTETNTIKLIVCSPLLALIPVILLKSVIYDNARHLMYFQILVLILTSLALVTLIDRSQTNEHLSIFGLGAAAVLAIKLLFDSFSLFPYNYVYVNELAQNSQFESRWEFDYYGISAKETQEFINHNYANINEASLFYQSFVPYMESNIVNVSTGSTEIDIYAQLWRPAMLPDYFESCPKVFEVTRKLNGREILLSYARQCSDVARVNSN